MRNPFVGLRPFETSEEDLFFGREHEIGVLIDLISTLPVLIVYAPSGTGKSSLLNAGISPRLDNDESQKLVFIDTTQRDVSASVANSLALLGWKTPEGISLRDMLHRHWVETDQRAIVILDQFEERLNSGVDHGELYSAIARLVHESSDAACIVISIREDYLGGLEPLMRKVPSLLNASYKVPSLSHNALERAIHGPLARTGETTTVQDSLVAATIADLSQHEDRSQSPGEQVFEPGYFQIVWSTLWQEGQRSKRPRLTVGLYRELGGSSEILKNFTADKLSALEPVEVHVFWAMSRYLVLPTGAKVALTVDDLILLQKKTDYLTIPSNRQLSSGGPIWVSELSRQRLTSVVRSVLRKLTASDAPLFKRIVRDGREEFELLHDLLGSILLEWRADFEESFQVQSAKALNFIARRVITMERELRKLIAHRPKAEHNLSEKPYDADRSIASQDDNYDDDQMDAEFQRIRYSYHAEYRNFIIAKIEQGSEYERRLSEAARLNADTDLASLADESEDIYAADVLIRAFQTREVPISMRRWAKVISTTTSWIQSLALDHSSADVRRAFQQQLWYWNSSYYYSFSEPAKARTWRVTPKSLVPFTIIPLLACLPLVLANWLSLVLFSRIHLQYTWLSIGFICVAAIFCYALAYADAGTPNSNVAQKVWTVCFPSLADPVKEHDWWEFVGWWPLPLLTCNLLAAAGAWAFEGTGFSPTAGFNVGLLAGGLVAIITFFNTQDL